MPHISYRCKHCKEKQVREVQWIDPQSYSKPEKANIKVVFWCKGWDCGQPIALRIGFLLNQEVKIICEEPTDQLYSVDRDETVISARPKSKRPGAH